MGGEKRLGHVAEPRRVPPTLTNVVGVAVMSVRGEVDLATVLVVRTAFGRAHGQRGRNRVCGSAGMAF